LRPFWLFIALAFEAVFFERKKGKIIIGFKNPKFYKTGKFAF